MPDFKATYYILAPQLHMNIFKKKKIEKKIEKNKKSF